METKRNPKRFQCVKSLYIYSVDEKFLEIREKIAAVFLRYGLKSVTMDDIAKELKISKKTLYKYVKDKNELILKVMQGQCDMEKVVLADALTQGENAIEELMIFSEMLGQKLQQMNPSVHYDLEKYYPEAWSMFTAHKEDFILGCVQQNIERGMKEGIYRDNVNAEIVSKLYIQKIDCVFDPAVFPVGKFTFYQVHLELMRYHVRGIANEKGMEYLSKKIKKDHSKF
jgi:AcrR family transcriptional regulator